MGELLRRIRYLLHWRRHDAELADEMAFHREMSARAGRKNFGNTLRLREESSEAWGWMWLDRLTQDLRFAVRISLRAPAFTFTAILVLAIGIGVNLCAFSFFDAVAWKPLPVRDAARIVRLERRSPTQSTSEMPYPTFLFYSEHAQSLSATIAVLGVPPIPIDDDLQPTSVSFVTPNYFSELGTPSATGRVFDPRIDGRSDAPPVVVLSYGLWQQRFGGDPSIVGRVIELDKKPFTVVGVTTFDFASLGGQHPEIWIPISQQPYLITRSNLLHDWTSSSVRMWAKLAPSASPAIAERELRSLTNELRHQHPEAVWDDEYIQSSPGGHLQVMSPDMYTVAGMVGALTFLILLVTCTNLGGLMLARAVARESEIGIRIAIGAGRSRIFRQLCTESLVLAAAGSVAGLALATASMRIILTTADAPKWLSALPDWRVALFAIALSFIAALIFGLAPSLQIIRHRQRKTRVRQLLMATQIAASCVLLIVASLLVRAAQHAIYTDPGFRYQQLLSIDPQLGRHDYTPQAARAYLDQMEARLLSVQGLSAVSLVKLPPLGHATMRIDTEIRGHIVKIYPNWVAPDFFAAMGIPLRLGRTFYPGEKNVVIVSESFARQQWPSENPLGQLVGDGPNKDTVIGVAGDARINALNDDDATEQYWPAQPSDLPDTSLVVRANGDTAVIGPAAKSISESLDASVFPEVRQIKSLYLADVSNLKLIATVVTAVGLVAVALSCVGIVGLVAFTISQRTKEIAIRIALGADSRSVLAAVLQQFRWPIVIGLVVGTALAAAGSKLLRVSLYGISNLDAMSYLCACALLAALVMLSMLLPATRALRLNVATTLRGE